MLLLSPHCPLDLLFCSCFQVLALKFTILTCCVPVSAAACLTGWVSYFVKYCTRYNLWFTRINAHVWRAEGVLSDSEEDRIPEGEAQQNTTSAWSSTRKQSSEHGGYSSEASSEQGESTCSGKVRTRYIAEHKTPQNQIQYDKNHKTQCIQE